MPTICQGVRIKDAPGVFPHLWLLLYTVGADLARKLVNYQSRWMAESTEKTRRSQWNAYMNFCTQFGVREPLPAKLEVMLLYVTHLADCLSYSSLKQYLGGLWQLHKLHGCQHIDPNNFELYITLRQIRRVLGDSIT